MDRQFTTERLLLLPGNNERDNDSFIEMLRQDGDFEIFTGAEPTEKNIRMFHNYLECKGSCFYTVFEKENPQKLLGYVGIGYQKQRFEAEFYISKQYRNKGYCSETLKRLCGEAFSENLEWIGRDGEKSKLIVDEIYATVLVENDLAGSVLEKCGFIRNPVVILAVEVYLDADDITSANGVKEYVLKGNQKEMKKEGGVWCYHFFSCPIRVPDESKQYAFGRYHRKGAAGGRCSGRTDFLQSKEAHRIY